MIQLKKHIAFFLCVIFLFPITFQPLHVVWHHAHGYKGKDHFHLVVSKKNTPIHLQNIIKAEKICPIGEYQFAINNLPQKSFYNFRIPFVSFVYNIIAIQKKYAQVLCIKTPRAPPLDNVSFV